MYSTSILGEIPIDCRLQHVRWQLQVHKRIYFMSLSIAFSRSSAGLNIFDVNCETSFFPFKPEFSANDMRFHGISQCQVSYQRIYGIGAPAS